MLHLKLINYILTDQPKDKRGYLIERHHIDSLIQLSNEVFQKISTLVGNGYPTLEPEEIAVSIIKPWLAESITDLIESKKETKGAMYHIFSSSLIHWYYYQYKGVNQELQALQKMVAFTATEKVEEGA